MNGNDFMAWVLRSPLHGLLSGGMLLLTVTGKKTGKQYTVPVGYYVENGVYWVMTSRNRTWWKNLRGGAKVELLLKRKSVRAAAQTETEESAVALRLEEYLRHVPQAASRMGILIDGGKPNSEDLLRTAKERLFVRFELT